MPIVPEDLVELILNLPNVHGLTLEPMKNGRFVVEVDYPPIPLNYPDGKYFEIPDDDAVTGATPEEALIRALLMACLEWSILPDGSEGDLFDQIERIGPGKHYANQFGDGMVYQTTLAIDLPLASGVETIYLTNGTVWIDKDGEVIDEDPPEYHEALQPTEGKLW